MIEKFLVKLQSLTFIVMIYIMCTRYYNKYDEIIVITLGIVTLLLKFKKKNFSRINLKITIFILLWTIFLSISFLKSSLLNNINEDVINSYKFIVIDGILLFFIVTQIKLNTIININKLLILINALSIYPIYKGIVYSLKNGFFVRGVVWGNPNTYAILLGIFALISFISFLFAKSKKLKIIYLLLNCSQIFFIVSIGQSRTTLCSLLIVYFIGNLLFYYRKGNLKEIIKVTILLGIVVVIFWGILEFNHLRVSDVSIEALLTNSRVGVWKQGLKEHFNIFIGRGFAYYFINNFTDSVGVNIVALHNDSLELLVTQGIFSLLSYWGIIIISLYYLIKEYIVKKEVCNLIAIVLLLFLILLGMLETTIYLKRLIQYVFLFLGLSFNSEGIKDETSDIYIAKINK